MTTVWEYGVEVLGGVLRGARPEDLEALLNEAAQEGWEPVSILRRSSNSSQLLIVLRRQVRGRSQERSRTWP